MKNKNELVNSEKSTKSCDVGVSITSRFVAHHMAVLCSHIIMFTIYFNPVAIPSEVSQLYGIGTAEQQYGRMRRYRCIFCAAFGFSDIITGLNDFTGKGRHWGGSFI